jgi:hypothetical protein
MFESKEETLVLEIVRGFFGISGDEMMRIGDQVKNILFDPGVESEEEAIRRLKEALVEMPKEYALISGMFISGLLRCNLAQQVNQQCMQSNECGCPGPE